MSALLTVEEAAQLLRLHPITVRRMAREGRLAGAVKVGSRWRFRGDVLVAPAPPAAVPLPARRPRRRASAVPAPLEAAMAKHRPVVRSAS